MSNFGFFFPIDISGNALKSVRVNAGETGYELFTGSGDMLKSDNLSGLGNYTTARSNLGLGSLATQSAIITDYLLVSAAASAYQPISTSLTTLAGLTATTNNFIVSVGSAWASRTPAQVKTTLAIANTDVSGLGTLSTQSGTFSGTSSGTNTGDQTSVSGNAGTVTNATFTTALTVNTGSLTLTANSANTSVLTIGAGAVSVSGSNTGDQVTISGNAGSATILQTTRQIFGNDFNGSADISSIIASTYGGTGNGFAKFSGPTTSEKTFTLPDASSTLLYSGGALGTPSGGTLTNCTFPTLNQNTSGSAASLTTPRTIGGVSFNGTANISILSATGGFTITGGSTVLAACTTSIPSMNAPSGTLQTTPAAGDYEFDGVAHYMTVDSTSKRGEIPVEQHFHLAADGTNITTTIANFFGSTSNISLVASAYYEIEIMLVFLKTTTEILTITLTNSAAPTSQNIMWQQSPITGMVAPPGTATCLVGFAQNDTTAAKAIAAGSLTTAVNHFIKINIWLKNGTGTSLKIQATNPAGSITPRLGSYWKCRRIPPGNTGAFAA